MSTFADGAEPWTHDISHGELVRDGYDESPTVDPEKLQMLFQGAIQKATIPIMACRIGSVY